MMFAVCAVYICCRYFGNGKTTVDTLNANEKILVNNPLTGTWKVGAHY